MARSVAALAALLLVGAEGQCATEFRAKMCWNCAGGCWNGVAEQVVPPAPPSGSPIAPPTKSPTSPTTSPTLFPTDSPTPPTPPPTNPPTDSPTVRTTTSPTVSTPPPTAPPTDAATAPPTDAATPPPTNPPTDATPPPTNPPTASTNAPTVSTPPPTAPPTDAATAPPTDAATPPPTNPPTAATPPPTNPPTDAATPPPTNPPTAATSAPTTSVTVAPSPSTPAPTSNPTVPPPTRNPTIYTTQAPTCEDFTTGRCNCVCDKVLHFMTAFPNVPSSLQANGVAVNAKHSEFVEMVTFMPSTFYNDMRKAFAGDVAGGNAPVSWLADEQDWNKLFAGLAVDYACVLPLGQATSGPTEAQYNNPEICKVMPREAKNDLANAQQLETLYARKAQTQQVDCFAQGATTQCTVVISFIVMPTWREGLSLNLDQVVNYMQDTINAAASLTSDTSSWAYEAQSVMTVRTAQTKHQTAAVDPSVPTSAGAIRPLLVLVVAGVAAFFL